MKESYSDFIGIFENAFPKDYCDFLIKIFNENEDNSRERPPGGDNFFQDVAMNALPFIKNKKTLDFFYKRMNHVIGRYVNQYRQLAHETTAGYEIADFKIQKTKPTEGYHVWHSEFDPGVVHSKRWGVWTLYLNDIKDGGETEFLYQSIRVTPKPGTVCLFPAYYTHTHRGNPPLKDTKYIVTGWLLYPPKYVQMIDDAQDVLYNAPPAKLIKDN